MGEETQSFGLREEVPTDKFEAVEGDRSKLGLHS